ncbi:MAG: SRPBCC family protein [Winogradskyella sp.]|uniref:SRPBCC family protein n=1 Tax=Winogradskyella sp. TaxID=1883156 RepID=UPI0017B320C0|nr:SRPBCC family protein [Winogradskyella sp.]
MSTVHVKIAINVPAKKAWATLSSFSGIEEFSPIASSEVNGQGVGAKRTCTMPDGSKIYEVMNEMDNDKMHMQYAILSGPFPITNYISDVDIKAIDNSTCEVSWACSFNPNSEKAEAPMKETFEGFYNVIIEGLENKINQN